MGTKGLTDLPERVARTLIERVDGVEESHLKYHFTDHRVDLVFETEAFDKYAEAQALEDELKRTFVDLYRKGEHCPHDSLDDWVTTQTYQQSAGLNILNAGADLSGGEVIQVCAECGCVIKIIKEASVTGESE
jgi:hypothetical protein